MQIRLAVPDRMVGAHLIEPALETVTRTNERLISSGFAPPLTTLVRRRRVRWMPEPAGQPESFDSADAVAARGWGDCDDLAPYWAAELRASGKDPGARAVIRRSGPHRWHAVVRRSDGRIQDPSRAAGMGHGGSIAGAAIAPYLRFDGPAMDWGNEAVCHLPAGRGYALAHRAWDRDPRVAMAQAALDAAISGVCHGDLENAAICGSLASLYSGMPIDGSAQAWGSEIGSLFSALSKAAQGVLSLPTTITRGALTAASDYALPLAAKLAQTAAHVVPGANLLVDPVLKHVTPMLQSALHAGIPLASQLAPLLVPGLAPFGLPGAFGANLDLLKAILPAATPPRPSTPRPTIDPDLLAMLTRGAA